MKKKTPIKNLLLLVVSSVISLVVLYFGVIEITEYGLRKWASGHLEKAEKGDVESQLTIGMLYENGWGLEESKGMSKKWYLTAANSGSPAAKLHLCSFMEKDTYVYKLQLSESQLGKWCK